MTPRGMIVGRIRRPGYDARTPAPPDAGFTLVELVIAVALGSLLLLAIYQVLLVNQRAFQRQSARIQVQQTVRGASDVLSASLREVSPGAGDLIAVGPDTIRFRSPSAFAVACDVTSAPTVVVEPYGVWIGVGDSILIFAENDPADPDDDRWLVGLAATVDTTAGCGMGRPGARIDLASLTPALSGQTLGPGAPVRAFMTRTWGLRETLDAHYLSQWVPFGDPVPLVGPLGPPGDGLVLRSLDRAGNVVADPLTVAQIEFSVRAYSRVLDGNGNPIVDSLTTRVSLRN